MSFLTPLFLVGLAALAIPVLIHLIQRERRRVVEFPSLMFLQRIPYRSVRRRHIRHWALLVLRLAALALIVAAFARPFFRRSDLATAAASGAREVVVLLDRSYSMGYAGRWERARAAARNAVNALGPADRASVVLFSIEAEVALRSTGDRGRLLGVVGAAEPDAGATRYGPALKLAGSILSESALPRREAVLITDFQRTGWERAQGVRLPEGATLTPVSVAGSEVTANVAVTPVSLERSTFAGQERVTVTAGVINRSGRPAAHLAVTLEVGGRGIQTERVDVAANSSASTTFAPFTVAARDTRGTVRLDPDALARDDAFHFVVSPAEPVRVVVIERGGAPRDASLYLTRALSIGDAPRFDVTLRQTEAFTEEDAQRAGVVVLNDVPVTPGLRDRIGRFVDRGGGLLAVLGPRAAWPSGAPDLLPALPAALVDRSAGQAGRLGALEYGHPVFELFRTPRSGDFSAARFYGYRAVAPGTPGAPGAQVLARFDDGAPALLEKKIGRGRVLLWTSTLDLFWNDLALKPVFLPFVHRLARHLATYAEPAPWMTVGQVLEPPVAGAGGLVTLTPSGRRLALDGEGPDVLELAEQGFYEIRPQGRHAAPPITVAANVDLTESDLTTIDPKEIVAAASGHAGVAPASGLGATPTPEAQERAQRIWWYLLCAGVLLLGVETILSNRLSNGAGQA
jgi:hypothetical protein